MSKNNSNDILPSHFKDANRRYRGNGKNVLDLNLLELESGHKISEWKPTFWARIRILFGSKIYLSVISEGFPPVALSTNKPYYFEGSSK